MTPSHCLLPTLVRCVLPYTASLMLMPLPSVLSLLRALSLTLKPLLPLLLLLRALAAPARWGRYRATMCDAPLVREPGELGCALRRSLLASVEMKPLSLRLRGGGRGWIMPSLLLSSLLFRSCGQTISGSTRLLARVVLSSVGILLLPVLSAGRVCSCGASRILPALGVRVLE